jgi:hypothetical protein
MIIVFLDIFSITLDKNILSMRKQSKRKSVLARLQGKKIANRYKTWLNLKKSMSNLFEKWKQTSTMVPLN